MVDLDSSKPSLKGLCFLICKLDPSAKGAEIMKWVRWESYGDNVLGAWVIQYMLAK